MRPHVLLVCLLVSFSAAARAPRATPAALRKAFENNQQSVIKVVGPKRSGPGVVVGASGQVLTSVDYVGLHEAAVEIEGTRYAADVLVADAYQGLAVVQIRGPPALRATPVKLDADVIVGQSLVAVVLGKKGPSPRIVVVRRLSRDGTYFQLNVALRRGAPVFDARGRLLGIALGRRVLPVDRVKQTLAANAG